MALKQLSKFALPDLAIVLAGSDPYEADELPSTGGMALTLEQLMERDRMVYSFLTAAALPAAYLMAGGYGENSWRVYAQFLEWVLMKRLTP
jgi:acetoin utilization deacetylase AcuC-like enzyme